MQLTAGRVKGRRHANPEPAPLQPRNHPPAALTPIASPSPDWPPGKNGFGYGGAVRLDSATTVPGSPGTFRWAGYGTTFFWIDPKADLIAMVWAQYLPVMEMWRLGAEYHRPVYAAVTETRTNRRPRA